LIASYPNSTEVFDKAKKQFIRKEKLANSRLIDTWSYYGIPYSVEPPLYSTYMVSDEFHRVDVVFTKHYYYVWKTTYMNSATLGYDPINVSYYTINGAVCLCQYVSPYPYPYLTNVNTATIYLGTSTNSYEKAYGYGFTVISTLQVADQADFTWSSGVP
jgi:hypothetical protein